MAYKTVQSLDADITISLGGFNKKQKKENPTSIEGYYLGTRQVDSPKSKTGKAAIHTFQTAKGNVAVWGKTDMDRKLQSAQTGVMTRVSFDKMKATTNGEMYVYKVEIDPDNSIEVDTPRAAAAEDDSDDHTASFDSTADDEDEVEEDTYEAPRVDPELAARTRAAQAEKVKALLAKKNK